MKSRRFSNLGGSAAITGVGKHLSRTARVRHCATLAVTVCNRCWTDCATVVGCFEDSLSTAGAVALSLTALPVDRPCIRRRGSAVALV